MYSMMGFFGLLSVTLLMLAIEKNTRWLWLAYFAATFLGSFTHYFFYFLVIGEGLYFIFFQIVGTEMRRGRHGLERATWRHPLRLFKDVPQLGGWLASNGVIAFALLVWLRFAVFLIPQGEQSPLLQSVAAGGLGYGQGAPSFAVRFNDIAMMVVETFSGFHAPGFMYAAVAMWPLAIYVLLMLFDFTGPVNRRTMLLLCSASGIPMIWAIGQWQGQVLASRYFMAVLSPLLILSSAVIARMPRRFRVPLLVAGVLIAFVAYADQSFNPTNIMRYDNREAIGFVAQHAKPGDIILYEPFYIDVLFRYYLPPRLTAYDFPQHGKNGTVRDAKVQIGQDLARVIGPGQRVWLVLSFQDIARLRGDAYNTEMWLIRHGYRPIGDKKLNQVQILLYEGTGAPLVPAVGTGLPQGTLPLPAAVPQAAGVPATSGAAATSSTGGVAP